jgi:hypothetical protein
MVGVALDCQSCMSQLFADEISEKGIRSMNDWFGPEARALGMQEAHQLYERISRGDKFPPYYPEGIVLQPNETGLGGIVAEFSRYMALEVQYPAPRSMFLMGPPAFMAGALIAKLFGDAADRRDAARLAARAGPQWRFIGFPIVVLTDQRMIAHFPERHELISFWHSALVGFKPNMTQGSLELIYTGCPAVRLHGPRVPVMLVAFTSYIHPPSSTTDMP